MSNFEAGGNPFNKDSRYAAQQPTAESQGKAFPEYVVEIPPESNLIELPMPEALNIKGADLRRTIEQRRSVRRYDTKVSLSLPELSYLLWLTQGVKRISEHSHLTLRTVPSAGSRHPFETYLAIRRVDGLEEGIYWYVAHLHKLQPYKPGHQALDQISIATNNQGHVLGSAVTFIWVANPYRTTWRYGSRGYRYIYLDAGHVCQNLYLAAESIDYGVCAIGAFSDQKADEALDLDGEDHFVIYMASVGKKFSPESLL